MYNNLQAPPRRFSPNNRIQLWFIALAAVLTIFLIRLFYLQVIRHDYYKKAAIQSQLKEYDIKPRRGVIDAHDGSNIVPIVLNEVRYTLFADPKFIDNADKTAELVVGQVGGDASDYAKQMRTDSRYVVLAKKLTKDQKAKIDKLELKGIGTREESYRTYPQGGLAAQLLGFVNDDGEGKYGIEQYMNEQLRGVPGQLKAITDANGIPLVANEDNVVTQPKAGDRVVLTIDVSLQKQLQDILRAGLKKSNSGSGSALIIDPYSGKVKAMANLPSYNPAEFFKVKDANVFTNAAVSAPLEVGSVMKPLTAAAALDNGAIKSSVTYHDPSQWKIDGYTISNIEEDGGAGTKSLADILQLSLNTGATWLLMQMGGGQINQKERLTWHDYMSDHYRFGKLTGIEQGYEAGGTVPDPRKGYALNLQYANTAFGQGMTATPLQMAGALSSIINNGTYYQPTLVDQIITGDKTTHQKPKAIRRDVIKPSVSSKIRNLMQYVVDKNYLIYGMRKPLAGYVIGGKTGTAEIAKPGGGYYEDRFNGMFIGYVGAKKPKYVIIVLVNEPHIAAYAGAGAAAPIFGSITDMLIDNFGLTP